VDENKANEICGHHKGGQYIYSSGLKKCMRQTYFLYKNIYYIENSIPVMESSL